MGIAAEVAQSLRLRTHIEMIRNRENSGKSIKDWCLENGIARSRYNYWQKKIREMGLLMQLQDEDVDCIAPQNETVDCVVPEEMSMETHQPSLPLALEDRSKEEHKKYCTALVMECQSSGKTVKDWCEENDVCESTYYRWQQKAREDIIKQMDESQLAMLQIKPKGKQQEVAHRELLPTPQAAVAHRELPPGPQAAVPSGWAIYEPAPVEADSVQGIIIEIGKGRITVTEDTDSALLMKVCRMLVAL